MPRLPLLLALLATTGCHYARKWTASTQPPANAKLVSEAESGRSDRDESRPGNVIGATSDRSEPSSRSDVVLIGAEDDEAGAPQDIVNEPVREGRDRSAKSRWNDLLDTFRKPRAIPFPRTDLEEPEARTIAAEGGFDGF